MIRQNASSNSPSSPTATFRSRNRTGSVTGVHGEQLATTVRHCPPWSVAGVGPGTTAATRAHPVGPLESHPAAAGWGHVADRWPGPVARRRRLPGFGRGDIGPRQGCRRVPAWDDLVRYGRRKTRHGVVITPQGHVIQPGPIQDLLRLLARRIGFHEALHALQSPLRLPQAAIDGSRFADHLPVAGVISGSPMEIGQGLIINHPGLVAVAGGQQAIAPSIAARGREPATRPPVSGSGPGRDPHYAPLRPGGPSPDTSPPAGSSGRNRD